MSKIEFQTGNFKLNINGELNDESRQSALDAGLTYIVQRDVATKVYRELKGEGEKKTLPKDFERSSVEFNAENAEAMRAATEKALAEYGDFTVTVEEHVKGETTTEPGKMAKELWAQAQGNAGLRAAMFASTGIEDNDSDENGEQAARAFLATLRPKKEKKA